MIALDIQYSETKSLWLDLKIMFKTLPTLLGQVIESKLRKRAEARPAKVPQQAVLAQSAMRVEQTLVAQK